MLARVLFLLCVLAICIFGFLKFYLSLLAKEKKYLTKSIGSNMLLLLVALFCSIVFLSILTAADLFS